MTVGAHAEGHRRWWRRAGNVSVTAHLWLMMGVVAVMAMGALTGLAVIERADAYDRAADRAAAVASRAAGGLDGAFMELDALAKGITDSDMADAIQSPDECELSSGGFGAGLQLEIHVVDNSGTVVCSSAPAAVGETGYGDTAWFADLEEPGIIPTFVDPVLGRGAAAVAAPIIDPATGARVGVMMGVTDPASAPSVMAAATNDTDHDFVLTDADGTVLSHPDETGAARFLPTGPRGTWEGVHGIERRWASAEVPSVGWTAYAGIPTSDVVATANREALGRAVLGLFAIGVLALLTWNLQRRVARPLHRLTETVKRAGREFDPERVVVEGPAEIRELGLEYNAMLRSRLDYESRLTHQALHDPLTDLPNRTLLIDRLDQALERSRRTDQLVGVLFLDVDRFKVVNDSLGHDLGDRVLMAVAERLRSTVRPGDTVARFGGDEFVVLCDGLGDADEAARVAERARDGLASPLRIDGHEFRLTASVGIAVAGGEDHLPAEEMLQDADAAMYEAKHRGRDAYEMFDTELRVKAATRLQLERELRVAVDRGELELHYQPEYDLRSGRIVAAEALLRWNHPVHGHVPPLSFIPVAEESGLIVPIGRFVLEEACRQRAQWAEQGHPIRMAVNVSPHQLRRSDLVDTVTNQLHATDSKASDLCLELTESTLIDESGPALHTLMSLRELGVRISVDDFGTGYSSLGRLRELPVDELKVDRSFVAELLDDRPDRWAFLAAIITMGHSLGLEVVAEGIEEAQQLERVRGQRCDLAQGYHLARPMPAASLGALLERQPVVTAGRSPVRT